MASIWRDAKEQTRFESTAFETDECTFVIERDTMTIDNGRAQMDLHLSNGLSHVELRLLFPQMARHVLREGAWNLFVDRAAMGLMGKRLELIVLFDCLIS